MRMPCRDLLLLSMIWLWWALPAASAQQRPDAVKTPQPPPVLAHFPPVALLLETPALTPGRTTCTSQAELEAFCDALATMPKSAAHTSLLTLGITPGGRKLHAMLISKEGAATPADVAKLNRPVVWMIGQQHGNEPAGSEAMLALAKALADGELTPVLDALSVVIIPRANPDGAAAGTRDNAGGFDLNRDHGLLTQPEVQMIRGLFRQLPPALVADAHEFTVGQRWVEKLGGLQSIDLMVLSATHPMVQQPLRKLADELFQPAIEQAIAPFSLRSFVYHTLSSRVGDRSVSVGGNAPGIARNAFGLSGAVSFLLESRGVGIGLDSYQRRVATHYVAARALLQTAAANAQLLAATVAAARSAGNASSQDLIVGHAATKTRIDLPLMDATTGQPKSTAVDLLDTRVVTAVETRARPAGYIVLPERAKVIAPRLAMMGANTCSVERAIETAIEKYDVLSRDDVDRRAINPLRSVSVRVRGARANVQAGSLFVPLDQPAGTVLALALEPDIPGSLSALELIDKDDPSAIAIWRLPRDAVTQGFADVLSCAVP